MRQARLSWLGAAALVLAGPAAAQGMAAPAAGPSARDSGALEVVPSVNPGDQIGIACNALNASGADSDVRVVLTISAAPGETPPGYKKVLATDEQIGHGAVRVRIPTVPDLEDHTVNVNVYVMGENGASSCDAGHVKIVRQKSGAPGSVG